MAMPNSCGELICIVRTRPSRGGWAHPWGRRGAALLDGVRGAPPSDVDGLADVLVKLATFAAAHPDDLETIDLNPVLVRPKGQGVVALDALVVPRRDLN